jgi:uronate dehydrogenase
VARVLVTGAAGAVGQPVCRELRARGHVVVAFDRQAILDHPDAIVGNIADQGSVEAAMSQVDAVVHLAAQPHDVPFEELIEPNVLGLYRVMKAAQKHAVRRVVLASSIQVLGSSRDLAAPAAAEAIAPVNHYALTKVWAESMGAMYARKYAMSVVCVRVAWMVRNLAEASLMVELNCPDLYLSQGDAGRFFAQAVEARNIDFAILYAASRGGERLYDMEPSRRLLGYEPKDRWPSGLPFEVQGLRD